MKLQFGVGLRRRWRKEATTEMLKLYDYPDCPFCQKVRVVLAEKDLEYEKIFVDLRERALTLGFQHVEAGPLVRSSYRAWNHVSPG